VPDRPLPWNLISQRRLRLLREAVQVGKELLIDEVVEVVAGLGGVVVELAVLALRAAQLSQRYGLSRIVEDKGLFLPV
jgi:hypothetical protein